MAEKSGVPLGEVCVITRLNIRIFFLNEDSQSEKGLPWAS